MSDDLVELLKKLAVSNPTLLKNIEEASSMGIKKDKVAMYEMLVKENVKFDYVKIVEVLERHENSRLDINWNKEDYIFRIVISRRKRKEEKKDGRNKQPGASGSNGNGADTTTTGIESKATGS